MMLDDYNNHPGINISTLKEAWSLSPLHYLHRTRVRRDDTDALTYGNLVHCATLEPDKLSSRYKVRPEGIDGRTKAGKAQLAALDLEPGTLVSAEFWSSAISIAAAVRENELVRPYLTDLDVEVPIYWTDAETGMQCKGRADGVSRLALVGLKTTRNICLRKFANDAAKFGYHLQWAFYYDGWLASTGEELPPVEIVVESHPPHDVVVYRIPEEVLDAGREAYRTALVTVRECRQRNVWPGVANGVELTFQLPKWAVPNDDDDLTGLDFT